MQYQDLASLYASLEGTSKRLEKTVLIADFLKQTLSAELEEVLLLLQGRVFPLWDKRVLGLSEKLLVKALSMASGAPEQRIMDRWRKIGDIGKVAEELMQKKTQATLFQESLSVDRVFSSLRKVAASEGKGAQDLKMKLVASLLSSSKGVEARYVVRSVIGDLRIGVADGTLRDGIGLAFLAQDYTYNQEKHVLEWVTRAGASASVLSFPELQAALDRTNDFAKVALIAKDEGSAGLAKLKLTPGVPLKAMLAQKVADFSEGFGKVGKPCAVEYKFDGFRMQVHKLKSGEVKLFTRRLEEVSAQFPDVVKVISHIRGDEFILDAEAVGYDPQTKKYRPFQDISQRIRRKYDIHVLESELPVELAVFDVLFHDGLELIEQPFEKRRAFLASLVQEERTKVILAPQLVTADDDLADAFYKESLAAGNEGVMLKKLDAPYQPGSRVGTMIKLKPIMDTLDLAIVGAEWGTGKRSGWLTSFTVACMDDGSEELLTIGKFGTGIKEKEEAAEGDAITFEALTNRLKPLISSESGREVVIEPNVIVEVKFEEIQKSPSYGSGFALRFPRFVKVRDDRGLMDMTVLSTVEAAYQRQRGRHA